MDAVKPRGSRHAVSAWPRPVLRVGKEFMDIQEQEYEELTLWSRMYSFWPPLVPAFRSHDARNSTRF